MTRFPVLSNNLYVYCVNNPVNMIDSSGMFEQLVPRSRRKWDRNSNCGVLASIGPIGRIVIGDGLIVVGGVVYVKSKQSEKKKKVKILLQRMVKIKLQTLQVRHNFNDKLRKVKRQETSIELTIHMLKDKQKPHVHLKDGTSLNKDGTVHVAHKGIPDLSNKTIKCLLENGWKIGE